MGRTREGVWVKKEHQIVGVDRPIRLTKSFISYAVIAQLVERVLGKDEVPSSNLGGGSSIRG